MIRCDTTRAGQPQKMLEACNFGLRKKRDWATYVAKTKVPLSSHVQNKFSHVAAQMRNWGSRELETIEPFVSSNVIVVSFCQSSQFNVHLSKRVTMLHFAIYFSSKQDTNLRFCKEYNCKQSVNMLQRLPHNLTVARLLHKFAYSLVKYSQNVA